MKPKLGNLDETNYRQFAQSCIDKYNDRGMIVDAMLWSAIIGHYEHALVARAAAGAPLTVEAPPHVFGCRCEVCAELAAGT